MGKKRSCLVNQATSNWPEVRGHTIKTKKEQPCFDLLPPAGREGEPHLGTN